MGKKPVDGGVKKITDSAQQSPDEIALCAYVRNKVEEVRSQSNRIFFESTVLTNTAYLVGYDGVYWDSSMRQFRPINNAYTMVKRDRVHINKILPRIQNRLAKLCKNPPRYEVAPNSPTQEDKDAARLGQQCLTMIWDKQKINNKRIPLYMWLQQAGHSFGKVSWDTRAGKMISDPLTGEQIYEGDVRFDVASPLEVFVDPLAKDSIDEAQWVIQAKVRPLAYFRSHYPERGALVKEESAWLLSAQYENRIQSMNNTTSTVGANPVLRNSAIEIAYYEAPSNERPRGRMCITGNGVLLEDKELPCGKIPFVKFDDVKVAGKFFSEAIITHMRSPQDQYNRTISRRAEWVNKLLAGKYISPRGAGLAQEALNDTTEVLEYDPTPGGSKPEAMQIPQIPQYAYVEEERLDNILNEIPGISEVSQGNLPSASIPAIGMQFLEEMDQTRIGVETEQHEHAWAEIGSLILSYVGEYYKTPRMLKLGGQGLQYLVKEFAGADLKGNYDVRVVRGSTLPGSKAVRRQEVMNAFQSGVLGDPNDPAVKEKVLGLLEYGEVGEMWEDLSIDMNQINRQIEEIKKGVPVKAEELDNHPLHIKVKNRLRKSEEFKQLSPESQQALMLDIEAHIQLMTNIVAPGTKTAIEDAQHMADHPISSMATVSGVEPEQVLNPEATGDAGPQAGPGEAPPNPAAMTGPPGTAQPPSMATH